MTFKKKKATRMEVEAVVSRRSGGSDTFSALITATAEETCGCERELVGIWSFLTKKKRKIKPGQSGLAACHMVGKCCITNNRPTTGDSAGVEKLLQL